MGHFVMTIVYRVRASLPFFLPLPVSPIGTLGAVIAMDGSQANRRQLFDIGLAGPLAGLIVAIPIIWVGTVQLDLKSPLPSDAALELPLAMQLLVDRVHPGEYQASTGVPFTALNPYFMAGWVGLLVTALNMMPVSQLDGGHVMYTLFGRAAHWAARWFMLGVFVYLTVMKINFDVEPTWILMALLVLVLGTDHPPTADDRMPLGWGRTLLGAASLLIPIFCFTPHPLRL
jgi:membrane-associated protease RseP (regulator of RpoE activity)